MAIEIRHETGAAPVAAAAFSGAQGQARSRAARGAAAAATRLDLAAQARKARTQEVKTGREFQAAASTLAHERGLERQGVNAEFQQQAAVAAQGRRREDLEFGLTTRQRSELDQLADAEARALSSPNFSEEEKVELRRKFAARRAGIKPVERPRKLTTAEKFKARTFTDKFGRTFALDEQGGPTGKPIIEPPEREPTFRDRISAFQAASGAADNLLSQPAAEGVARPSRDALIQQAMAQMGFGGGEPGPGASPAAQPGAPLGSQAPGTQFAPGQPAGDVPFDLGAPGDAGEIAPGAQALTPQSTPGEIQAGITRITGSSDTLSTKRLDPESISDLATAGDQLNRTRTRRIDLEDKVRLAANPTRADFDTGRRVSTRPFPGSVAENILQVNLQKGRREIASLKEREAAIEARSEALTVDLQQARAFKRFGENVARRRSQAVAAPVATPALAPVEPEAAPAPAPAADEGIDPNEGTDRSRGSVLATKALNTELAKRKRVAAAKGTLVGMAADGTIDPEIFGKWQNRINELSGIPGAARTEAQQKELLTLRKNLKALSKAEGVELPTNKKFVVERSRRGRR